MQKKPDKKQSASKIAPSAKAAYSARAASSTKGEGDNQGQAEDRVRLKPILGLRPGIWLAVLYSLIILIVLFFILIYPGLKNPGSLVLLKTEPAGAALRVDGIYRGTAPDKIFVSRGKHSLEAVLPGFSTKRIELEIPGRLFASALFPKNYPLEISLDCSDAPAAFAGAAADYAAWTFGGEPVASWQIPLSLSDAAYRLGPALVKNPANTAGLLKAAARFAVTRAAARDLIRAQFISRSGGLPPSPAGILDSSADIIGFLAENPGSAAWLASLLPPESAAIVNSSAWYTADTAAAKNAAAADPGEKTGSPGFTGNLRLGGLSFTGMGAFMICDTQVPYSVFAAFLAANPEWKAENREALIQEGLASSAYLEGSGAEDSSIHSVSWYAAQAFCQWLGSQLPASMAHNEVRLPAAAEWNRAALIAHNRQEALPWEWCADPFVPLDFIKAPAEAAAAIGSPERAIRGVLRENAETSSSLPPEFCSPFISFRPVIAAPPAK